jgi:2-polyprenyl-3-methyl-5-hydroxy-6-metoxy-1,4-benzoquinol methylase
MTVILQHNNATVRVEELPEGRNRLYVELVNSRLYSPMRTCETTYPLELISKMLDLKGPCWLCNEILRDESPEYVQKYLKYDLLCYQDEKTLKNKRWLDFGCGSGASTMILARMFPYIKIVGIELEENLLSIARLRAAHYGYKNMELMSSPHPDSLPLGIGCFDFVLLCGVYEHLLPNERETLLQQIWGRLKLGGILFLNQTPYRYFPIEFHTTGGLPFINYLPDKLALKYAKTFSKRNLEKCSWEDLLRRGIRGGSVTEILSILNHCSPPPILLKPSNFGVKDRIDLWCIQTDKINSVAKVLALISAKLVKWSTGKILVPYLSLAIKKGE